MWWWRKKKRKIPKEKDKWDITMNDALEKYGSATNVMEEIFKDNPAWLRKSTTLSGLTIMYLREQYYRKNPQ